MWFFHLFGGCPFAELRLTLAPVAGQVPILDATSQVPPILYLGDFMNIFKHIVTQYYPTFSTLNVWPSWLGRVFLTMTILRWFWRRDARSLHIVYPHRQICYKWFLVISYDISITAPFLLVESKLNQKVGSVKYTGTINPGRVTVTFTIIWQWVKTVSPWWTSK